MNKQPKQLALTTALLIGFFTLFFLGGITRELLARFGGSLEATACGLLLLMIWIIAGSISLPKRQYSASASIITTAILPFTAIIGIITIAILPNAGTTSGITTVLFTAGAGTFLFGINSGVAYVLNSYRWNNNYIGWVTGAIAGGVSYQLCNQIPLPETLLLFGSAGLLFWAVFIKKFSRKMRVTFATYSLVSLIILGWLWQQQNNLNYRVEPNLKLKSFEQADGRYSVIVEKNRRRGRFILAKNSLPLWKIPDDYGKYSATALFSAMQHPSNAQQRVLIIASPFTTVPALMLSLPNIDSVDLLCQNKIFASLSAYCGILPPPSPRFNVIVNQQYFFIPSWELLDSERKYDLIMLLDDIPDLPLTLHLFSRLKNMLNKNGVVTIGVRYQRKKIKKMLHSLSTIFREVKIMKTNPALIAAGDSGITISTAELDARFSADGHLPAGTFAVLYSTLESAINDAVPPPLSQPDIFILPPLPWNSYITIFIAFIIYLICRFMLSRRHNNAILFAAGENGFYTMIFIIIIALYFQTMTGQIYSRGLLPIATIMSGIALGALFFSRGSKTVITITLLSIIIPGSLLLLKLPFIEQWPIEFTITPILICVGIATGCCHVMLRHKTTLIADNNLPIFEFIGGIVAVSLSLLHYSLELNMVSIVAVLTAVRLTTAISIIKTDKFTNKIYIANFL